jgi:uncharacterized protein YodC (DUF2158 family)
MAFKVGDVVRLKSGGVDLTIENVSDAIECVWSDDKKIFRDKFKPETLTEGSKTLEELILASMKNRDEPASAA